LPQLYNIYTSTILLVTRFGVIIPII